LLEHICRVRRRSSRKGGATSPKVVRAVVSRNNGYRGRHHPNEPRLELDGRQNGSQGHHACPRTHERRNNLRQVDFCVGNNAREQLAAPQAGTQTPAGSRYSPSRPAFTAAYTPRATPTVCLGCATSDSKARTIVRNWLSIQVGWVGFHVPHQSSTVCTCHPNTTASLQGQTARRTTRQP